MRGREGGRAVELVLLNDSGEEVVDELRGD
jgi:hypothetical protein